MSRYIDADKLKEHYMWWGGGFTANCKNGQKEVKKIFDEIIDLQPTADVRENVKGEWRRRKDTIQCSQCKAKWIDHTYLIETFRFCPNCGADMKPITALSKNAEIDSNSKRGDS